MIPTPVALRRLLGRWPDSPLRPRVLEEATDGVCTRRLIEYETASDQFKPALAESWQASADGRTYTFRLRRGVRFHNGREFVAASLVSWLSEQGVACAFIEKGRPQQTPYVERFNGAMRDERLNGEEFNNVLEARVVLDLMPAIYDRPGRVTRILRGDDDSSEGIALNAPFVVGNRLQKSPHPQPVSQNLGEGCRTKEGIVLRPTNSSVPCNLPPIP